MSAVIREYGEIGYIHTSEMAVADNKHWLLHRALSWTFLDSGRTHYVVACRRSFDSDVRRPSALSSGVVAGPHYCPGCFGHLATEAQWAAAVGVSAVRQASVNELITMLGRLQPLSDVFALKLARDCWSCIADLGMGCHCEEAAHTLVLSAEHWLSAA